jgi:hypothetical protein
MDATPAYRGRIGHAAIAASGVSAFFLLNALGKYVCIYIDEI